MIKDWCQAIARSRWFVPGFCVAAGAVMLAVSWAGGHPGAGIYDLGFMAGFGLLLLLLGGRSETVRGLTFRRDERFAQIDLTATAVTGLVLVITVIVAWFVETARGQNGHPYDWLAAIGGVSYILAIATFRWRG